MAEDVRALLDHLEIERADVMGYSMGVAHRCVSVGQASGARAVGDTRRARHSPRGRSWTSGKHRRGTRSANGCRREGSDGADVSDFRRTDKIGSARARGLYSRLAADLEPRGGCQHHGAGTGRGRHEGQGCRRRPRIGRAYSGGTRSRYPRSRPHACGRRQGLQGRRYRFP